MKPGEEAEVTSIEMKKQGRLPPLGKNMDNHLQQLITEMRSWSWGTSIGTVTINAIVLSCATFKPQNFLPRIFKLYYKFCITEFFHHENFHAYGRHTRNILYIQELYTYVTGPGITEHNGTGIEGHFIYIWILQLYSFSQRHYSYGCYSRWPIGGPVKCMLANWGTV